MVVGIDSVGGVVVCVLRVIIQFDGVKRSNAFFIGRAMEEIVNFIVNNITSFFNIFQDGGQRFNLSL